MSLDFFFRNLTVMGDVSSIDPANSSFVISLLSGQELKVHVGNTTSFQVIKNLDNVDADRVPDPEKINDKEDERSFNIRKFIFPQSLIVAEGVYSEHKGETRYDARNIYLMHSQSSRFAFEDTHWWITQISRLADQWLDQLFGDNRDYTSADFAKLYRSNLNITGMPTDDNTQETATLSRLIYGLCSAYMLTGCERYLTGARAGVQFQREAFRHLSHDGRYCFWAFGRVHRRYITQLYESSQNPEDIDTIPLYEQIYALAGLTQYYRITLDWQVLEDIRKTIRAFNDFYLDGTIAALDKDVNANVKADGYFSHIDCTNMCSSSKKLGQNSARKNWNSIGDHIPAYLINLILALEPLPRGRNTDDLSNFLVKCKWMLEHTSDLICAHFPDQASKYVNERFLATWIPDHEHGWQQNRGIIGHNLKIAWNMTRAANYMYLLAQQEGNEKWRTKGDNYMQIAKKIADDMSVLGIDQIRGGCFDAVERNPSNGMPIEFAWSSTKDFWQQEQGILAYLILYGSTRKENYRKIARYMMAFWNLYFLDHDYNGIIFRVNEDGIPITRGSYGVKAGHAISGYHAFELNFLAHIYIRSFIKPIEEADFVLYFKPDKSCGQQSVNVLPDFFQPCVVRLKDVTVGGLRRSGDLPKDFQVDLSPDELGTTVVAEFDSIWRCQPPTSGSQANHKGDETNRENTNR
ncbi:MAG: AGE family epimerase/isomerase [Candidatus Bathyarchaeota archaeon]|nr:AGE family epimerase/isomerase [Candidatus Bathyarchaeota archaeon]